MSPPSLTVRPIMPDVDGWHESTWQHQHDTKSLRRQALTTTSVQTGKKKGCSTGTRTRLTPPKYCYFCYSTLHSEQYTHFSSFDYFYWGHRYGFFVKQGFGGWGLKFVNIILAKKRSENSVTKYSTRFLYNSETTSLSKCEILGKNKYRDCKISREKSLFRCCVVRAYAKTFYSAAKCWEQSRAEQRPRFLALVVH